MTIEVLGDGCPKCRNLEKNVRQALAASAVEAELLVVNDPGRIAHYQLLTLPGLAIDGQLKFSGRIFSSKEIGKLL